MMELQDQWNRFAVSGRIEDYLEYRMAAVYRENNKKTLENKAGIQNGSGAGPGDRNGFVGITDKGI